jgi:cytochrome oxidase Cu insertion factor (SCO1/SenC/PrrC family)
MRHRESVGKSARGLLILAGLLVGVVVSVPAQSPLSPVAVGKPAHDFSLTLLSGQKVKLSDFRGKVLLLNFWASW